MAEHDYIYSDSDWLDISSGLESDDNASLSDQDSDRDEINSFPHSRRSSFSTESSLGGGEIDAWEGFVSDSGEEVVDTVSGFVANTTELIDPFVAEEDQRVKEALDQSFVGTLVASRSSAAGLHSSSAHTSTRDLRLSFPDPLTSRDDLNGSYQDVTSSIPDSLTPSSVDLVQVSASDSSSPLPPDQVSVPTTEVQHDKDTSIDSKAGSELDIILYGASSSIKWQFVLNLIRKSMSVSGHEIVNTIEDGHPIQTLRVVKKSNKDFKFFETINVVDRTSEDSLKVKMEDYTVSTRRSLAIVYLPTLELPSLNLHDAFLPVVVPTLPKTEEGNKVMRQAAEDDWDLLGVPTANILQLTGGKVPLIDSDTIADINPYRVYELLSQIGEGSKKHNSPKPLTEKFKSVNAVTIFGVMSVVMGFAALNTMFHPQTLSPTPTVNPPPSSISRVWQALASQSNRSTGCNQVKDCEISNSFEQLALSIYDSRMAAISVTSPSSISLIVPSTSKVIIDSCVDPQKPSTDVMVRSSETSLSRITEMKSSLSVLPSLKSLSIISAAAPSVTTATKFDPTISNQYKSISEAFDATTKVLSGALGNDFSDLVDAADDLFTTFVEHTDTVIQQSKGKARLIGEHIQTLNEEVVSRNQRAKKRAKELKKKGRDIVRAAKEEFKERTKRAKERAKELKHTVVDGKTEALKRCNQHETCGRVFGEGQKNREPRTHSRMKDAKAEKEKCRRNGGGGVHWAKYRARHFPF